jgi:HPt (histidine-containing phosphotransfer) domain-containing protein
MTAHSGPEERRRCLDSGMDEHVAKPIDRSLLASALLRYAGMPSGASVVGKEPAEASSIQDVAALVNDEILEQLRNDAGPALVNELVGAYMAETDERLTRMESAFKDANLEEIGVDAHSMKSSSGTFGALQLQDLAAQIEAAAMRGEKEQLEEVLGELPDLVSETWSAFAMRGFRHE